MTAADLASIDVIEGFPLAPQQRRIWQIQRGGPALACQVALTASGDLDPAAVERAARQVTARHEILRTRYDCLPGMELPIQVIAERCPGPLPDARPRPFAADQADPAGALLREDQGRLGGRGAAPPALFSLLPLAPARWVLAITVSSLAADEWSLRQLVREVLAGLAGEPPAGEPVQYTQFSEWQNDLQTTEDGEAGRGHWRARELAELADLRLPAEAAEGGNFWPASVPVELPAGLAADLEVAARRFDVHPSSCLLAAWHHLLARAAGRPQIALSVLCGGRPYEEMHESLGLYRALAARPDPLGGPLRLRRPGQGGLAGGRRRRGMAGVLLLGAGGRGSRHRRRGARAVRLLLERMAARMAGGGGRRLHAGAPLRRHRALPHGARRRPDRRRAGPGDPLRRGAVSRPPRRGAWPAASPCSSPPPSPIPRRGWPTSTC